MKKVAIIHNIIAPYRFPLFNELSKQKGIDVTVLFMTDGAKNRKWDLTQYTDQMKFKYKVLPNWKFRLPITDYTEYIINPTIITELCNYDCVITAGWLDFSCQMTYLLKEILGYKYIIWSESTINEPSWQRSIAMPYVTWALKRASSYIAIGTRSKEYLESLGAPSQKIVTAYSTVDTPHFTKRYFEERPNKKRLREKFHIDEQALVCLYVGQFIERKNVTQLIMAVGAMKSRHKIQLILMGYGPLQRSYEALAKTLHVNLLIVPHGEVEVLTKIYTASDIFILPSKEETWGLVVNEAMASGLPVLVSNKVGSVSDLVEVGKNGFIFSPNSPAQLSFLIESLLNNPGILETMSRESLRIIENKSPLEASKSFARAIAIATT